MGHEIKKPVHKGVAKVPFVMQMEWTECGAASLSMLMAYYGKWVPLEQVRLDTGVSRDGPNVENMLKAARNYGMKAEECHFELEEFKKKAFFPCIIPWGYGNYAVLRGFKKGKACLNDPSRGSCEVTMEQFENFFTGQCLLIEPGEDFVPSGKPKSVADFAKKKLIGTGAAFALVIASTVITSLTGIITPGMTKFFSDRLLTGLSLDLFKPFMLIICGFTVVQLIAAWINSVYSLKANGKIAVVANSDYMWHVLRLPMEFFSQRMAGDISSRRMQNSMIASNLISILAPLVLQSGMMFFYLILMLRYSPLLSLVGVLSIAINLWISNYISAKRVNITRITSRDSGKLAGATVAGIEMIETIKASGAENGFFEKWSGYQASVNSGDVEYTKLNTTLGLVPNAVGLLAEVVVLMGSVWLCMQGEWTVGTISAFNTFLNAFTTPAMELIYAGQIVQELRTDMERIEDVMEYPIDSVYEEKPEATVEYNKLSGKVELRNVTFGYSRTAEPLIENFSMSIEPGQRVAFVGPSGCGKSTLSKLISGLYKPWSGEILFDGKPMSEIDRNVFVGSLSVVDQDIILFEDSIANNIKMWDNSIQDFEMILAARDAQIHEDIMQRVGGYRYKLTEGGRDLSGGQRQRLEIARVLAEDPTIIILDEATSALDAKTEYGVVKSICDRGITCIVVAHRLSTIRDCDEIIVLDHGKVVERGKHDELYSKGGAYAELVTNE